MPAHFRNSDLYRERLTESALVYDYPADEPLIRGLHALQAYFATRNARIDIPVVQVMNTAHFAACYMFSIPCADQMEYDMLVYDNMGSNKQLAVIAMIVLSAMLKRTDEPRASTCRSILLEDRSEDFYEGVSLYEQFLESEELHFAAEDFESDVMNEVVTLREQNAQLVQQVMTMQKTIKEMNQQNNQFNIGTQNNYNGCTFNKYYIQPNTAQPAADPTPKNEDKTPDFFCVSARFPEENIRERLAAELSQATTKIDYCRGLYRLQHMGCINIDQYASDAQRAIVFNNYQSRFNLAPNDFCRARSSN